MKNEIDNNNITNDGMSVPSVSSSELKKLLDEVSKIPEMIERIDSFEDDISGEKNMKNEIDSNNIANDGMSVPSVSSSELEKLLDEVSKIPEMIERIDSFENDISTINKSNSM